MSEELDNLEQTVEREMALLGKLPPATPRPECVAELKAAVRRMAGQQALYRRTRWVLRAGIGAAAAVLLVAVLLRAPAKQPRTAAPGDPEAVLGEWAVAWDESSHRLGNLLDGGWISGGFGGAQDAEADANDFLNSLDQSLEALDTF